MRYDTQIACDTKAGQFITSLKEHVSLPQFINAQGNQRQEEPLEPIAEQPHGTTGKLHPVAINHSVVDFPTVKHAQRPRIANAKGDANPARSR